MTSVSCETVYCTNTHLGEFKPRAFLIELRPWAEALLKMSKAYVKPRTLNSPKP